MKKIVKIPKLTECKIRDKSYVDFLMFSNRSNRMRKWSIYIYDLRNIVLN